MSDAVIKYSELIKDDGGFEKLEKDFLRLSKSLEKGAKKLKKNGGLINVADTVAIRNFAKEAAKLEAVEKKLLATQKQLAIAKKRNAAATKKATKMTLEEREALARINRERRLEIKVRQSATGSIEQMRAKLALVSLQWARETKAMGTNSKLSKSLERDKVRLTKTLKRLEKQTGDNRRNVGNYSSALGRLKGSLLSVAQASGVMFGVFGAVRLIQGSVDIIKDFEKTNATLSGVLQVAKSDMTALTDESIRLGSITVKTAQEVAGLELSYARLGFTQNEILALTEDTITGSIALNSALDETALLTGAMVRTFDEFDITDAATILDVMSLSTAKSALNFEKLQKALPIVGGAANAAGVPFNTLVALLGKLADAGIDVSSSSTSIRNIFIDSAKAGEDYTQIIERIKNSQEKLTTAADAFGKRAAISATVLANQIDGTKELNEQLNNAAGTMDSMAKKELDTLDGALKLLQSAWEGYILNIDRANGFGETLKIGIKFLADNLSKMLNTVVLATKLFILYKAQVAFAALSTQSLVLRTNALAFAHGKLTFGLKRLIVTFKAFNLATKASIIGAVAIAVYLVVDAFSDLNDEVEDYVEKKTLEEDIRERTIKSTSKEAAELSALVSQIKLVSQNTGERNRLIKKMNNQYGTTIKNTGDEEQLIDDLNIQYERLIENIRKRALASAYHEKLVELEKERLSIQADLALAQKKQDEQQAKYDAARFGTDKVYKTDFGLNIGQSGLDLLQDKIDSVTEDIEAVVSLIEGDDTPIPGTGEITAEQKRTAQRNAAAVGKVYSDEGSKFDRSEEARIELLKKRAITLQDYFDIADEEYYNHLRTVGLTDNEIEVIEEERFEARLEAIKKFYDYDKELRDKKIAEEKALQKTLTSGDEKTSKDRIKMIDDNVKLVNTGITRIVDEEIEQTSRNVDAAQLLVEEQRQRAVNGLDNTLAEQQVLLVEAEKKRAEAVKRQQKIEKVKALYSAYSSYAQSDAKTALPNTLRDFAIMEAISVAFGDGGVVEDKLPADGIFRGASHKSRSGGIPIKVEGKEGIFTVNEMANLGKENFYALKNMASNNTIDSDLFTNQNKVHTSIIMDAGLKEEMRKTRRAIESKPELSAPEFVNGMLQVIERRKIGNKISRNIYRTTTPKL